MRVVVAPQDRKMRIEVGYGLEGTLTDVAASRIIRNVMTPAFKNGDFDRGIEDGVAAIVAQLEGQPATAGTTAAFVDESSGGAHKPKFTIEGPEIPWYMRILLGCFIFGIIGIFTVVGVMTPGMGWFLYVFLIPFWAMFPIIVIGPKATVGLLALYLIGYPAAKLWFGAAGPDDAGLTGGRLLGAVMHVFSTGTVTLASDDPTADPTVDFAMLSDDRDRTRLRDGVRRMIQVARHPAVAAISDGVTALSTPLDELDGDGAIDDWLRANVTDYVHAVGTCRMGAPDDPAAVVDTDCRVIGYQGLRVCDASVMPDLPRANTHLTTVAIAELLARRMLAAGH